jgi:hypothetical protein
MAICSPHEYYNPYFGIYWDESCWDLMGCNHQQLDINHQQPELIIGHQQ